MNIEQRVKQTIIECLCLELDEINRDEWRDNSVKLSSLAADSLDFLDLDFQLDKQFDGKLLSKMEVGIDTTVQDVIDYVTNEIGLVA